MVCGARRRSCDNKIAKEYRIGRYTQKQIEKFNRQKYIGELEKIGKNLFRMLRDERVSSQDFTVKFEQLKQKFDEREAVQLDSEYHRQMKQYIERLYEETCNNHAFDSVRMDEMREAEMSNLNRLQKLKNASSYKKEKHKAKGQNEDWG